MGVRLFDPLPRPVDAPGATDCQFLALARAYGAPVGMVSGDEVAGRMRRHCEQPVSVVARLIVRRGLVNIVWRSGLLIPLFQFRSTDMAVLPSVSDALGELGTVFDDWEVAQWFARPNALLHGRRPMDMVASDGLAVVQAARADRDVERG